MTVIRGSVDVINMYNTGECSISHKICVQDVVNIIEKLKLSKADANFKLLSDNLLYGCHELFIHSACCLIVCFKMVIVQDQ